MGLKKIESSYPEKNTIPIASPEEYGDKWATNERATDEYSKTILILTQSNTTRNIQEQLKTLNYLSQNIHVKMEKLLLNE